MSPNISIIIPTFNRAHIISETLDSILMQEYSNWECIIVDDGSIDGTERIISNWSKKDARFRYYQRPTTLKKGPSSCRNFGFSKCKGTYVHFFDSDDLYKPRALDTIMSNFSNDIDAVVAKLELVEMQTAKVLKENRIKSTNLIEDHFLGLISFYVCGPIWKRTFLNNQSFLFNAELSNGDDWDFNLRMLYSQPRLKLLDTACYLNRVHSRSLSKERNKLNKEELKSYFNALKYHQKKVRKFSNSDPVLIEDFVIDKYLSFLRVAVHQNNSLKHKLFKKTQRLLFSYNRYKLMFKVVIGYLTNLIFNKGYRFFKI